MKSPFLSVTVVGARTFRTLMGKSLARGIGSSTGVCAGASNGRARMPIRTRGAIFIFLVSPVLGSSFQQVDNVWNDIGDGIEGLDGAGRRSRQVDDQSASADSHNSAGQNGARRGLRTFRADVLGHAGDLAVDYRAGGFGRDVALRDARAPGGEHDLGGAFVAEFAKHLRDTVGLVGEHGGVRDFPALLFRARFERGAGAVLAGAVVTGVADGDYGHADHSRPVSARR